jgi:hypothetical protein
MMQILRPESRVDWSTQSNNTGLPPQDALDSLGRTVARCRAMSMRPEFMGTEQSRPLLTHCKLVTILDRPE